MNDALKSLTIWGAYQHFEDDIKGSLEVGKVADFVLLSGDPFKIDIEDLDELSVVETIKSGKSIYKAGDKVNRIGMNTLPQLPRNAGTSAEDASDLAMNQPPRRGVYAYATVAGPCGCVGCTLGHIVTLGQRDVELVR